MLRLLCHIQQSSQSLRQTDIANIDTGELLIQLILGDQLFVYGAVLHALIKAIADQLHLVNMIRAAFFTTHRNYMVFDFLNLSR